MTTRSMRFRRMAAAAVVTAMPLTAAGALLAAHPAAAQFGSPGVNPFGTSGFYSGGLVYAPDNSTTEINNYGDYNTTVVDDGGYNDGYYDHGYYHGYDWDFPWWDDDWSWNHGWDGWGGGWF